MGTYGSLEAICCKISKRKSYIGANNTGISSWPLHIECSVWGSPLLGFNDKIVDSYQRNQEFILSRKAGHWSWGALQCMFDLTVSLF